MTQCSAVPASTARRSTAAASGSKPVLSARIRTRSHSTKVMEEAIAKAGEKGILFVAAAGNESNDNDKKPSYPASYKLPNVVSVAATDKDDSMAYFSNFGKRTVHVAAPGVGTFSLAPGGKYAVHSGTSMATPHVSGLAVLMLADAPGMPPKTLRARLIKGSDPVESLKVAARGRVSAPGSIR